MTPIRIAGVGLATVSPAAQGACEAVAHRFQEGFGHLSPPVRIVHPVEEATLVAGRDALKAAGIGFPVGLEEPGVAFGVEEAIDGVKARYYAALLKDGPLGASPVAFPLTTPNTLAARLAIL